MSHTTHGQSRQTYEGTNVNQPRTFNRNPNPYTTPDPSKDPFVRHCRTLLATGASARSIREQLLLNAAFFLTEEGYKKFMEAMPSLRYFQLQREGMGNESIVYSFMAIAQCSKVYQWGFDETSLNGIPTLNQCCRIQEGNEYRNVTIDCAGYLLLPKP